MKKVLGTIAGILALTGLANAATMTLTARYGESLATYLNTDNDDDDDDGFYFFDHYMANGAEGQASTKMSFNNMTFEAENNYGGVEAFVSIPAKSFTVLLLNGWINFGNLTLKVGRFNAYPAVDFVGDATVGYHYNSYAAQYQAGFDPQVMSWFLRNQGFTVEADSTITSTNSDVSATSSTLEAYNWYFYDPNNAGARLDYDTTYYGVKGGVMAQYNVSDNMFFRLVAVPGSAADNSGTIANNYYGERTLTNLNFQASYTVPDTVKIGATFKLSDLMSGVWNDGDGTYKSAGSDISAALAVSSDYFAGLQLYGGYTFGATYLGRKASDDTDQTFMIHSADLRAVYNVSDMLRVGFNGNLSMIAQSDYAKDQGYDDDYLGFNFGISASYDYSDSLAFDLTTGFRCLNVNNKITKDGKEKSDMLAVSCFGIEPGAVFKLSKTASLNLGVNFLLQNLSGNGDDAAQTVWINNSKASAKTNVVYPFTVVVSVPFYFRITM
ncbi:MAG: hypothetical protein K6F69_01495 [Treponema sp.]|nr:hypothetical protein [Treponema sp.]